MFYSDSDGVRSASRLQVRLGGIFSSDRDPDAVYYNVSRVLPFPRYDSINIIADIGLLQLTSPVTFTDTILPICLPSRDVDVNGFKVCVDTGFGRTSWLGW